MIDMTMAEKQIDFRSPALIHERIAKLSYAGTGIRQLGDALVNESRTTEVDLFFSHCHIDHIIGLPFFAPLYLTEQTVSLWAGHLGPEIAIEQALRRLMS